MLRSSPVVAVCLLACLVTVMAARPLSQPQADTGSTNTTSQGSGDVNNTVSTITATRSSRSPSPGAVPSLRQTTLPALPLRQRVIFAPGKLKVEDYLEAIYGGVQAVAQADPFIAAAGAGGSVGVPFTYEKNGAYDYEFGLGTASIGVGAKNIAAAQAKLRKALVAKGTARAQSASTASYTQNRLNYNTLSTSRTDATSLGGSLGAYIHRTPTNLDQFLLTQPTPGPLPFGKK